MRTNKNRFPWSRHFHALLLLCSSWCYRACSYGNEQTSEPAQQKEKSLALQNINQEDEDEYDWVTDTDEEYPEYQCDVCGRVMSNDTDRYHCEICEDYDLVSTHMSIERTCVPLGVELSVAGTRTVCVSFLI